MMQSPKGYEVDTLFFLLFPTHYSVGVERWGVWNMNEEGGPTSRNLEEEKESVLLEPWELSRGWYFEATSWPWGWLTYHRGYPSRRNGSRLATALNISLGMSHPPSHMPDMIQEHSEALHCFFIPRSGSWPQRRMEMMSGLDLALAAKAFVNLILEASLRRADAKL